ncbi:unnamed protein product, partial [Linum tenue]
LSSTTYTASILAPHCACLELICQVARNSCRTALSGNHTTIVEDDKLMEVGGLRARLGIAVGVRAGEKKVLQNTDEFFKQREKELDKIEYYQEIRLKDLSLVGNQGGIIFRALLVSITSD